MLASSSRKPGLLSARLRMPPTDKLLTGLKARSRRRKGDLGKPPPLRTGVRGTGLLVRGIGMLAYRLVRDVGHPGPMDMLLVTVSVLEEPTAAVSVLGSAVGSFIPPCGTQPGYALLEQGRLARPRTHGFRQCGMALRSSDAACSGEQKGK